MIFKFRLSSPLMSFHPDMKISKSFYYFEDLFIPSLQPVKTSVSPRSSSPGTFRAKLPQRRRARRNGCFRRLTSSMRPPRYHDQDFMAKRWSHQRGSTVFFNFSFHCRTKNKKKCASAGLWKLMEELKLGPAYVRKICLELKGSPAYPSFPGRGNVSHISLLKKWRTV